MHICIFDDDSFLDVIERMPIVNWERKERKKTYTEFQTCTIFSKPDLSDAKSSKQPHKANELCPIDGQFNASDDKEGGSNGSSNGGICSNNIDKAILSINTRPLLYILYTLCDSVVKNSQLTWNRKWLVNHFSYKWFRCT